MILTKLVISDFGLYSGLHEFALRPRTEAEGLRPLILFGGKNGAGKTTILEAVRLCLYGRDALGFRVREADYHAYIGKRIHHSRQRRADLAMVRLEFEYTQNGVTSLFRIERSWVRAGDEITEHLGLRKDHELQFGIGPEYWQELLKDLIPVGLADLFFFDGERIQSLADDEHGNIALGQALKDLLGVNLVEQLETDLGVYLTRQGKSDKTVGIYERLEALQQERERLLEVQGAHRQDKAGIQARLDHLRSKVQEKEAAIARRGGGFAESYNASQTLKQVLQAEIKAERHQLEEACAGLLPFALAPNLCRDLYEQLQKEEELEFQQATRSVLQTQAAGLAEEVAAEEFWRGFEHLITESVRGLIGTRLRQAILNRASPSEALVTIPLVHGLSAQDRGRIMHGIEEALGTARDDGYRSVQQLLATAVQLEQVERTLQAVPPEELLAPLMSELRALHAEEARLVTEFSGSAEAERRAGYDLAETIREISKIEGHLHQNARKIEKGDLAGNVLAVLNEFRQELLRIKIVDLEAAFTEYFNRLARKQELVSHVIINERDFSMTLVSREGRYIAKAQLSAGEKQIYAIALLWALRTVAARPLPIIIDTPLGRLDSDHRQNLVEHYFPNASHQVIVLSTDTEIDADYFAELEPFVSHAYHLVYDDATGTTQEYEGYFWQAPAAEELNYAT